MSLNSFYSGIKFYDSKNFPYQFSRSGDFTFNEAELLSNCGFIMQQLHNKEIAPENEEQIHFLSVLEKKNKPLYSHEHVYLKYLQLIKKKKQLIPSVKKVNRSETSSDDYFPEDT
ncbi:MAG: DUF413 domain-containing protein [Gammaproteobacteria bacterium]|nr:DUF413 domain-containing protein [Gammaproteobacteria bacterium]